MIKTISVQKFYQSICPLKKYSGLVFCVVLFKFFCEIPAEREAVLFKSPKEKVLLETKSGQEAGT